MKSILFLMAALFVFTMALADDSVVSSGTKKTAEDKHEEAGGKLKVGQVFHHPLPGSKCLKNDSCLAEASKFCLSQKAKYYDCNEQYRGTWITTCECVD